MGAGKETLMNQNQETENNKNFKLVTCWGLGVLKGHIWVLSNGLSVVSPILMKYSLIETEMYFLRKM